MAALGIEATVCVATELGAEEQGRTPGITVCTGRLDADAINEGLIKRLWKEMLNIDVQTPFVRMPWDEAMGRFGPCRPDRAGFDHLSGR